MRHLSPAALTVLGALLLPGLPFPARAQAPPSVAGLARWDDPLDGTARRAARLLQATTTADPRDSPRAFTAAARAAAEQEIAVRQELERSGTALAIDGTLEAARRVRDAELALAAGPAERLAAHERYWAVTAELERVTRIRVEAGQKGCTQVELAQARACCLRAGDAWDRVRQEVGPEHGPGEPAAALAVEDPLDARRLARLLVDTRREPPARRRESAAAALADAISALRELEMSAQALMLDRFPPVYLEWRQEMARDRETPPEERLRHLEVLHLVAAERERITQIRVNAAQKGGPQAELFESRAARLRAAQAIQEAAPAGGRVRFPVGILNDPFFSPDMDPVETRHYSRVCSEVMRPGLAGLANARRQALLASYEAGLELERSGHAMWVDMTNRLFQELCDAEAAAAATPGQSVPALASYLGRLGDLERGVLRRLWEGNKGYTSAELFAVRAQRLNAQRRLVEALAALGK